MKISLSQSFLLLGFVLIVALYSDAQPLGAVPQAEGCCFSFFKGKIPSKFIMQVKRTSSHCSLEGFIVTTPKFPSLCVREVSINVKETS
ncbi:C-C motif chemokine 3-like [Silurus meridionalis]|uniref:C-C motif chemokine 3-like n=1 Tax=Silurus meridionalis TaxID=175797 RepID=UPI001EEA4FD1|nr:C-C motif chemokine 3-like [Silurus meridionalis]